MTRRHSTPPPGLTLIETLCVVSLVALLAGIAAPSVLGSRARASLSRALDQLRHAHTLALHRSDTGASAAIELVPASALHGQRLVLTGPHNARSPNPDAEHAHAVTLDPIVTLRILDAHSREPLTVWPVAVAGASPDVLIHLRVAGAERWLAVLGATGVWEACARPIAHPAAKPRRRHRSLRHAPRRQRSRRGITIIESLLALALLAAVALAVLATLSPSRSAMSSTAGDLSNPADLLCMHDLAVIAEQFENDPWAAPPSGRSIAPGAHAQLLEHEVVQDLADQHRVWNVLLVCQGPLWLVRPREVAQSRLPPAQQPPPARAPRVGARHPRRSRLRTGASTEAPAAAPTPGWSARASRSRAGLTLVECIASIALTAVAATLALGLQQLCATALARVQASRDHAGPSQALLEALAHDLAHHTSLRIASDGTLTIHRRWAGVGDAAVVYRLVDRTLVRSITPSHDAQQAPLALGSPLVQHSVVTGLDRFQPGLSAQHDAALGPPSLHTSSDPVAGRIGPRALSLRIILGDRTLDLRVLVP